jgi:hypothetical protein
MPGALAVAEDDGQLAAVSAGDHVVVEGCSRWGDDETEPLPDSTSPSADPRRSQVEAAITDRSSTMAMTVLRREPCDGPSWTTPASHRQRPGAAPGP